MPTFTSAFAAGLAALALLLAAPVAQAQSTGFTAAGLPTAATKVASIRLAAGPADDELSGATHHLSALNEEAVAAYYDDSHKDLTQSLSWMQETNALHPAYWSLYAEARIRLQLQDYRGAQATAAEAKKLALAATPANADYARRSDALMAQAQAHAK